MARVLLRGISFAYSDAVPLFRSLSLDLGPGGHGIVGENGSGKTTLLSLVEGALVPDAGEVRLEPPTGRVASCPQSVEVLGPEVARLAAETDAGALAWIAALELEVAALARWDTLSPGERKRWQLAGALASEPDVLLLDEPTNHLDAAGRAALVRALRRFRGVGLYVSHDRTFLDELTTETLRVADGTVTPYPGGYSAAKALWELEAERAAALRDKAKRTLAAAERKLVEARCARAEAEKQRSARVRSRGRDDPDARSVTARTRVEWAEAAHGRSAGARRSEVERARAALGEHRGEKALGRSLFFGYTAAPRPRVLGLDRATVRAGDAVLFATVSLWLGREARVHLAGPNGSGKSTLLRALLGAATVPAERLLYLPQELTSDDGQALLRAVRAAPREVRSRTLSLLAALGVDPDRLLASAAPSAGEARKLLIAEGLARHVYAAVLDEPTNHLDLPSIERLEDALEAFPGALLLVSHDTPFAAHLATERWVIEAGRVSVAR